MLTKFIKPDSITSAVLIVFSIFVFIKSLSYPTTAALFPLLISSLIFIFSILLLLRSIRKEKNKILKKITLSKSSKDEFKNIIILLLGLIIYPFILNYFGYFISTSLLVYYTIFFLQEEKKKFLIIISIFIVIILFVIFDLIMEIPLPKGFLLELGGL